jgi:hypothetical protein
MRYTNLAPNEEKPPNINGLRLRRSSPLDRTIPIRYLNSSVCYCDNLQIAEKERALISARTRAALEAAKERGVCLGGPKLALFGVNDGAIAEETGLSRQTVYRIKDDPRCAKTLAGRHGRKDATCKRSMTVPSTHSPMQSDRCPGPPF